MHEDKITTKFNQAQDTDTAIRENPRDFSSKF